MPSNDFLKAYHKLQQMTRDEHIPWVQPNNFHLTLHFLGNVDKAIIPYISNKLEDISNDFFDFRLQTNIPGFFSQKGILTVLWISLKTKIVSLIRPKNRDS